MSYEDWQIQIIRDGLGKIKKQKKDVYGKKFSWPSLAETIIMYSDLEVASQEVKNFAESLRRFIEGVPHRDPTRKAIGDRYYQDSLEPPERIEAVVEFLTSKGSQFYMFSLDDLNAYTNNLADFDQFINYLNKDTYSEKMTNTMALTGNLFIAHQETSGLKTSLELRFSETYDERGLIPFLLHKHENITISSEEEPNNTMPKRYQGWAILTPEESIFLFAKQESNGENIFYFTLGIDKSSYFEGENANALVLLEVEQPEDTIKVNSSRITEDSITLFNTVKETLSQQLLLFTRKNKT